MVGHNALHAIIQYSQRHYKPAKMCEGALMVHRGGCHCRSVRFEVRASANLHVLECNCSLCTKKQNRHFIVPVKNFKLVKGHDAMSTYSYGSHQAKHFFCKKCGVQSFSIPRSNPDGYAITLHCLDEGTVKKVKVEKFNGKDWDTAIKKSPHIPLITKEKS